MLDDFPCMRFGSTLVSLVVPLLAACAGAGEEDGDVDSERGEQTGGAGSGLEGVGGGTVGSGGDGSGGALEGVGGDPGAGGNAGSGGNAGAGGNPGSGGNVGSGGSGECTTSSPPSEYEETLEATWSEMTGELAERGAGARPENASILNFENTILDQLMEAEGELRFCVRYESTVTVSETQRDQLEAALERNLNEWFEQLQGEDCFPFEHVPVKVVGWAAMSRNTFDWDDEDHPGLMYIGDNSFESAPQCAQSCGRFFHKQSGYQYPGCEGGWDNHYDMSLWLTEGMQGGAGGDWGQRVGRAYFMGAVQQTTLHILSHEMGHGMGFPDYYNWSTWVPGVAAPNSIMVAGAAFEVTAWDTWMMRRTWSELKADRGW